MNLTNHKAQIVNTTISNIRKNLAEVDFAFWQEVWVFEVFKTIASVLHSFAHHM
jgi:hypothetical protein